MNNNYLKSLKLHKQLEGKVEVTNKQDITSMEDLALLYSPGVAAPCLEIAKDKSKAYDYTIKKNTVAIVSDGSAVLGLGNIGPEASIPVMEGKAMLFKKFAGINAFPICLDTQDADEIIETVKRIAPVFGGINLEDISAPRSFYIEDQLQDIGIPVFHDDQHGTAIVALAGLINACRIAGKEFRDLKIVINGSGAAGVAIAKLLRCVDMDPNICTPVKQLVICDSKGIIHKDREDLNESKKELLKFSNYSNLKGSVTDAIKGADVFIGVSIGNLLNADHIQSMAEKAIVFALANPDPEILPEDAKKAGAFVVATGRSDYPNQVNNVLAFPGIFKGALESRAKRITPAMKIAAAYAIAELIDKPTVDYIIPDALNSRVIEKVSAAVADACTEI